jgi:hypothetical protein
VYGTILYADRQHRPPDACYADPDHPPVADPDARPEGPDRDRWRLRYDDLRWYRT